jgi:hypothetical protein
MAEYSGGSAFWTKIDSWVDTVLLSAEMLYTRGMHRLADRDNWLRDEIVRRSTRLASQVSGLAAVTTGSIDLSTLTYDGTTGTLNGLTLTLESDTAGPTGVAFGTGGSAPTSPADVVNQINTATSSDPVASLTAGNLLQISSVTVGGAATVEVYAAQTATAPLGLTVGVATGVADGGDGSTQVGVPAIGTIPAGTLKAHLTALEARADTMFYGQVVTDGVGGVTITAGSSGNFTAAISGTSVRITFDVARATAGFAALVNHSSSAANACGPLSPTTAKIDLAMSGVDLSAAAHTLHFMVLGA